MKFTVQALFAVGAIFALTSCATTVPEASGEAAPGDSRVEYRGEWSGTLSVQGQEIELLVKFLVDPTDPPADVDPGATMDIPIQGAFGLPLSKVSASGAEPGSTLHFELITGGPTLLADLEVTVQGTLVGTFTQGAASGEIGLVRESDLKPQPIAADTADPALSDSYPYDAAEVETATGDVVIRGTLIMPAADYPVPLVIIVAGSGPTDRNGNSRGAPGPNDSLKQFAEALSERGIAALRYDKRGVGASFDPEMDLSGILYNDFVNDFLSWVRWADADHRFSGIFVAGHSEGSLIALSALGAGADLLEVSGINAQAAGSARELLLGFVSIAGPAMPLGDLVISQLEAQFGSEHPLAASARDTLERINAGELVNDLPQGLETLFHPAVQPYLASIAPFDPTELAGDFRQAMLAVGGTEDIQVSASDAETLASVHPNARSLVIEGMNHVLKMIPAGDLAENHRSYVDPSYELSAELVEAVAGFVHGE